MMDNTSLSAWIESQSSALEQQLQKLVNLNTYTLNRQGVAQGMDWLATWASDLDLSVQTILEHHRLIKTKQGKGKRLLLIAHMDTVHPPDGAFQDYEVLADGFVRGPGVGDIKGGLLMGLWALHYFQTYRPGCDIQLIISADEEIGSPTLRDWYMQNQAQADYAIGLEPGFPQGELSEDVVLGVVQARKGSGRILFEIQGKAAHAGGEFEMGISAVEAMAQRIIRIHALTDLAEGITSNVGLVTAGTAANTIAESALAEVDYRFWTQEQAETLYQQIQSIAQTPLLLNPKLGRAEKLAKFEQSVYLPPMEHTPASQVLVETVLTQAKDLDQKVVPISRGGGSDANYISGAGVPSICGMGAPASGIHTREEMIHLPLLFKRLALLIQTLDALIV